MKPPELPFVLDFNCFFFSQSPACITVPRFFFLLITKLNQWNKILFNLKCRKIIFKAYIKKLFSTNSEEIFVPRVPTTLRNFDFSMSEIFKIVQLLKSDSSMIISGYSDFFFLNF